MFFDSMFSLESDKKKNKEHPYSQLNNFEQYWTILVQIWQILVDIQQYLTKYDNIMRYLTTFEKIMGKYFNILYGHQLTRPKMVWK